VKTPRSLFIDPLFRLLTCVINKFMCVFQLLVTDMTRLMPIFAIFDRLVYPLFSINLNSESHWMKLTCALHFSLPSRFQEWALRFRRFFVSISPSSISRKEAEIEWRTFQLTAGRSQRGTLTEKRSGNRVCHIGLTQIDILSLTVQVSYRSRHHSMCWLVTFQAPSFRFLSRKTLTNVLRCRDKV